MNTDTVELKLRRISDRNLLRVMQNSYFGKPLSKWEEETFASTIAQDVWEGTGVVQNTLNIAMTTRLPLAEALGDQPPDIYALSAGITRGSGAAAPALLTALDANGDAAFLSLSDPAFDLPDRGVEGRALNGLPLVAVLSRPDGAEYSRTLSTNAASGGLKPKATACRRARWPLRWTICATGSTLPPTLTGVVKTSLMRCWCWPARGPRR